MTADAKVGLLLGLAFIVIIAFLINGLPGFWDASRSRNGLDSEYTNLSSNGFILEEQARHAVHNINLRTSPPPKEERVTVELNNDNSKTTRSTVEINSQTTATSDRLEASDASRTYIVKSGESLASIAKQVYGEILGNKLKSVEHIYLANKDTLESPNDIRVGQKLTIPDLFTEVKNTAPVQVKNPAPGFFERTRNRILPPKPQYREYVVRNKDSLWSIAQNQLANGNRYNEILTLNRNIIKSARDLKPGMKLKLPDI